MRKANTTRPANYKAVVTRFIWTEKKNNVDIKKLDYEYYSIEIDDHTKTIIVTHK